MLRRVAGGGFVSEGRGKCAPAVGRSLPPAGPQIGGADQNICKMTRSYSHCAAPRFVPRPPANNKIQQYTVPTVPYGMRRLQYFGPKHVTEATAKYLTTPKIPHQKQPQMQPRQHPLSTTCSTTLQYCSVVLNCIYDIACNPHSQPSTVRHRLKLGGKEGALDSNFVVYRTCYSTVLYGSKFRTPAAYVARLRTALT